MLHIGYACLISGLFWAIPGYVSAILTSCWAILVCFVVCLGLCWACCCDHIGIILDHIGLWSACKLNPSFDNVRAIFCRIGLQCLQNMQVQFASVGVVLAHVGRFWATSQNVWLYVGLCRPMSALSWPMLGRCWADVGTC